MVALARMTPLHLPKLIGYEIDKFAHYSIGFIWNIHANIAVAKR